MKQNALNNATIRNATVCLENENTTHYTVFDIERDLKGWDFLQNVSLYGVSGGFLFCNSSNDKPSITRSVPLVSFDSSIFSQIRFRYKYVRNRNNSIANLGKVQFITTADPTFTDSKSIEFEVIPDGNWHTYTIDMNPVDTWVGLINNIKIFFSTNGGPDDEIFLEFIQIASPDFTICSDLCEAQEESVKYASNYLLTSVNTIPTEFSLVNTDNQRTISIQQNPTTALDASLLLSNNSPLVTGPRAVLPFLEGAITGYFSGSVRPVSGTSTIKLLTNLPLNQSGFELIFDSDGFLKYRSNSTTLTNFEIPFEYLPNNWYEIFVTFDVNTLRYIVSVNGQLVDNKIPAFFGGVLRGFSIEVNQPGALAYFDNLLLVEELNSTVCTGIGKQGSVIGLPINFKSLDIVQGVNDTIILNLNDYGNVLFNIPPNRGLSPENIRSLLQRQISNLDLGGYVNSTVSFVENRFIIKSGTYGFDSSVSLIPTVLSDQLGLSNGVFELGRPHAAGFRFTNSFREKSYFLEGLKKNLESPDPSSYFVQNPKIKEVEIGSRGADTVTRRVKVNGAAKTFIDFVNRATNEGKITEIFFHGRLANNSLVKVNSSTGYANNNIFRDFFKNLQDLNVTKGDVLRINTPNYLGNGEYVIESSTGSDLILENGTTLPFGNNLTYEIFNISKVKQFRPKKDGTLVLVNEQIIGTQIENRLYSVRPDTYKVEVDWDVHKGDLIGIYNPIELYAGSNDIRSTEFTYLEVEGEVTDQVTTEVLPRGDNTYGIGLYGSSVNLQNRAVLDIELEVESAVEHIEIQGRQLPETRFYNLLTAVGTGVSFTANVSGTHKHQVENALNGDLLTITHPNVGYNVEKLYDGLNYASNGLAGDFEQDSEDSTYFYIDGDAEWFSTVEFPPTGNLIPISTFDFQEDPYAFEVSWNSPKEISKFKMFFKEFPHAEGYFLEYQKQGSTLGDGTSDDFFLIGLGKEVEYTKVKLDKTTLTRDGYDLEDALYRHFLPVYDGYVSSSYKETIGPYQFYRRYPYNILDKEFTPIKTKGFKWNCLYHRSTKISEVELFSQTDINAQLKDVLQVFVAGDDGNFSLASLEVVNNEIVRFLTHKPIRFIRIITNPSATLELDYIYAAPTDDRIEYKTVDQECINTLNINPLLEGESNVYQIDITNNVCESADLEVNFAKDLVQENIVLKSSLNNLDSIVNPEIGPPGKLYKNNDANLYVTENVAINANTYALKNIAANKKYYEAIVYQNESDTFEYIEGTKWETLFENNYPQLPIQTTFPGFTITAPVSSPPANPLRATLKSRWHVTGSFNARIVADLNSNSSNADSLGSFLGIIDDSGRSIYIESVKQLFTGSFTGIRTKFEFKIVDSLTGTLGSVIKYGIGTFGVPDIGELPDTVPYFMNVEYINDPLANLNVLRFSYLDTVNNTSNSQLEWDGNEYFEIDVSTLNLTGQLKLILGNHWSRSNLFATTNGLGGNPYAQVKNFFFGGQSSYSNTQISFQPFFKTTGSSGEINTTNEIVNNQSLKTIALDLENTVALDILEIYSNTNQSLWDKNLIQYSNSNTSDVSQVEWGNATRRNCRWLLFQEESTPVNSSGIKVLEAVRAYPDLTLDHKYNFEWDFLGTVLTDQLSTTFINQVDYPIIALELPEAFSVSNFSLINKNFREFQVFNNQFNGWGERSFFSIGQNNFNSLNNVEWEPWLFYQEENKQSRPFKWIAFKNENFNTSSGLNSEKLYASEFTLSTVDVTSSGAFSYLDRIDFTEYPQWFNTPSNSLIDIAQVFDIDINFEGILYGATGGFNELFLSDTETFAIFDGNNSTSTNLAGASGFMWRRFGNVSGSILPNNQTFTDESSQNFILENTTTSTAFNYTPKTIIGFELEVASETPSVPDNISFQTLTGINPDLNSSWQTIYTEGDLAVEINQTQGTEYEFNNGERYVVFLESPITTSGVRLVINSSQQQDPELSALGIQGFKVFEYSPNNLTPLVLTSDPSVREGGRRSLKVTYPAGQSGIAALVGNFKINPDPNWSFQDYLSFYLKADSGIDWDNSYIRLGTNNTEYYEWALAEVTGQNLSNLHKVELKFKNAKQQSIGSLNLGTPSVLDLEPRVNFKEGPIEYFELGIQPLVTTTQPLDIWIDKFQITRENFNIPGRFNNTLYLNNTELLHFPLSSVSLRHGYLEMIVTPDWDNLGKTTFKKEEAFTIFSIANNYDETLSLYYHGRFGFTLSYTDNEDQNFRYNIGYINEIKPFKPFKVGILWNTTGKSFDGRSNANIRFYYNDIALIDFDNPWFTKESKNNIMFIGGKAPLSNVAFNASDFYEGVQGTYLQADVNSITGGVENILYSSVPKKLTFDTIQSMRDNLLISSDNIHFVGVSDNNLPLIFENISQGDFATVYIKANFPKNKLNLLREVFLNARWKIK